MTEYIDIVIGDLQVVEVVAGQVYIEVIVQPVGTGGADYSTIGGDPRDDSALAAYLDAKESLANKKSTISASATDYPNSNGVISYVQSEINTVIRDQGNYDASSNLFPATGGSGTAGAIERGNQFTISVSGTLGGTAVTSPYSVIRALVDAPGQTASNWFVENRSTPTVTPTPMLAAIWSGKWRSGVIGVNPGNGSGWGGSIIYTTPYRTLTTHTVTAIRLNVTTSAAGSTIRLALYNDSSGKPGALIEESGNLSSAATGEISFTFSSAKLLTSKMYFLALQCSSNSVGLRYWISCATELERPSSSTPPFGWSMNQAYGAFPANFSASPTAVASNAQPMIELLVQ